MKPRTGKRRNHLRHVFDVINSTTEAEVKIPHKQGYAGESGGDTVGFVVGTCAALEERHAPSSQCIMFCTSHRTGCIGLFCCVVAAIGGRSGALVDPAYTVRATVCCWIKVDRCGRARKKEGKSRESERDFHDEADSVW